MPAGGHRPNAGRKKGVPNKATREIKVIAQEYGAEAIALLARLMRSAKNEQTRLAAAKELLDRGYGKATQPLAGDLEKPLMPFPDKIEIVIVDPTGKRVPLPQVEQRPVSLRNSTH